MKPFLRVCAVGLALAVAMAAASPAPAEEMYRESAEVSSMMTKLARGTLNLFTGWMEVPKQVNKTVAELDPVSGTVLGVARGVAWAWARTACGAFEILTFPFPTPEAYEPIIEPEFILKGFWGAPLPVFSDPYSRGDEPVLRHF